MEHKFCSKGTIATNAQKNESTPKSSCIGHHWKYSNYAWQKTINKSAFEPGAAAVSCGEMGWKKLKYPRGVLSFFFSSKRGPLYLFISSVAFNFRTYIYSIHLNHLSTGFTWDTRSDLTLNTWTFLHLNTWIWNYDTGLLFRTKLQSKCVLFRL